MLSETTIKELRQILKEECGRNISIKEVSEIAHMLVGYYDLLAKIHHRDKTENNHENNNTKN